MAEETSIPVGTPEKMVLRTDNLVKKYGKRTVANHVSINV
ncbi:MAG: LPS export ABC transporter ATP-binding protein, partial [Duncaniella sp.]|nr:LPS export ABC transporter ATP-binding protein [Duncaniella sp.]